jgi:hypothetical protein
MAGLVLVDGDAGPGRSRGPSAAVGGQDALDEDVVRHHLRRLLVTRQA